MNWKIKRESNDVLRQKFIDKTVEQAHFIGLIVPDKDLKHNEKTGHWEIGKINWEEFRRVISGNGPCNHQRMTHHIKYHNEGKWVRDAALAFAKKHEHEFQTIQA